MKVERERERALIEGKEEEEKGRVQRTVIRKRGKMDGGGRRGGFVAGIFLYQSNKFSRTVPVLKLVVLVDGRTFAVGIAS